MKELSKYLWKYIRWFLLATCMIMGIDIGFVMMNTDSTVLFIMGIVAVMVSILTTIYIIKQSIKTTIK